MAKKKKKKETEIIAIETKALDANLMSREKIALLKRTIAKGSSDDELSLFIHICRRTGLDPFAKQIYLVPRWDGKAQCEIRVAQTGIDGYRSVAERTGNFAGSDEPTYVYEPDDNKEERPKSASVTVYRIVQGVKVSTTRRARWSEFFPKQEKNQFMWKSLPHIMLAKCAEAQALRAAFPQVLGGLYVTEEMDQAPRTAKQAEKIETEIKKIEPVKSQITNVQDLIAKIKNAPTIAHLESLQKGINAGVKDPKTKEKLLEVINQRADALMK